VAEGYCAGRAAGAAPGLAAVGCGLTGVTFGYMNWWGMSSVGEAFPARSSV
jgi:hypothetical protein